MITSFRGPYRFLSNFWPCCIYYEGKAYPSTEAAYQAAKTLDQDVRENFTRMTPAESKKAGRKLIIRPDWESVKLQVMEDLVRQKFTKYEDLKQKLLATGSLQLIEGNTWGDRIWGCTLEDGKWVGENNLGKILMKVREELRNG